MLSLRSFHLLFLLLVIVSADLFGVWSLTDYHHTGSLLSLGMGLVSFVGGFGLIVYALWFVRKTDRAHIA